jgi:hypothetical protein
MMELKIRKKDVFNESVGSFDSRFSNSRPFIIMNPLDDSRVNKNTSIDEGKVLGIGLNVDL